MATEIFNRVEHKYLVSAEEMQTLICGLSPYLAPDKYNVDGKPYDICNIYYDLPDHRLIRHSLSHPLYKEKLRLRSYGVPTTDSIVYPELKKKFRGTVYKRRTGMLLSEAEAFLSDRIPPKDDPLINRQVLSELSAFLSLYPALRPAVYISYDRLAFYDRTNPDLRISFDQNILTRRYDLSLALGSYGEALLPPGKFLMEIKATGSYPLWLSHYLSSHNLHRQTFSKYGTEYLRFRVGQAEAKPSVLL